MRSRLGQGFPRRLPPGPEVVEHDSVLVGVHAVPEAVVTVRPQLAVSSETCQGLALQHAVAVDVAERSRLEAEEAAVDPVLAARLLGEALDPVPGAELGHSPLQVW